MIKRIVKMSFEYEKIEDFKKIFETNWQKIKSFDGCSHVELLQDTTNPNIFFTFSIWENETAIENYRNSELFKNVWAQTKILFNDKPMAWSLNQLLF